MNVDGEDEKTAVSGSAHVEMEEESPVQEAVGMGMAVDSEKPPTEDDAVEAAAPDNLEAEKEPGPPVNEESGSMAMAEEHRPQEDDADKATESGSMEAEKEQEPPVEETASMAIDSEKQNDDEPEIPEPPSLDNVDKTGDDLSISSSSTTSTEGSDKNDSPDGEGDGTQDPHEAMVKAVSFKEEGNAFFKEGDYIKASRMYRRGVSILKKLNQNDEQVLALLLTLQTNQSMVCFKMGKYKQSRDVATKALELDSSHVKALYRRAVAHRQLGDYDKAKDDLRAALALDENNVSVKKELVSLKKHLQQVQKREKMQMQKAFSSSVLYKDKQEEEAKKLQRQREEERRKREELEKRKLQWEDECVKRMANNEEAISFEDWEEEEDERKKEEAKKEEEKRKQQEKERKEARRKARLQRKEESDDDNEEFTAEELALMKGYKKTKDGRTTSYFTREQSDHEKKLIGDIAPKRITEPAANLQTSNTSSASSAWNQAGTWEERDTTDWCMERLKSHLRGAKHANDDSQVAAVTAVKDLTGHASVAVLAGEKKRYIFDFHAKLDYEIKSTDDTVVASSQLHLPDISSVSASLHHELEILPQSWKTLDTEEIGMDVISQCRDGLVQAVRDSVLSFVKDFNEHY